MQGFPYVAGAMSAGTGSPVPGVPTVGSPFHPPGVSPGLTQYATPPVPGIPPSVYPPTYQGAPTSAGPAFMMPPTQPVPGPAALGTPGDLQTGGPGGVQGVVLAPVTPVAAPATTGGPHPLPTLPPAPLPQGFPNPFSLQQYAPGGQQAAPQPVPGTAYATGPQGYLPGLGYFGSPGMNGLPGLPGPLAAPAPGGQHALSAPSPASAPGPMRPMAGGQAMPWAQPAPPAPTAFPTLPGSYSTAPAPMNGPSVELANSSPTAAPSAGGQRAAAPEVQPAETPAVQQSSAAQVNPFWLQLSWQLLQTPAVRSSLGDRFKELMEGDHRERLIAIGAAYLIGPDLQEAFRGLQNRTVDQSRFTELFAAAVKSGLQSVGLLPVQ